MNENQLTIVKKYEDIKTLIQKKDSINDIYYKDCHNEYHHLSE